MQMTTLPHITSPPKALEANSFPIGNCTDIKKEKSSRINCSNVTVTLSIIFTIAIICIIFLLAVGLFPHVFFPYRKNRQDNWSPLFREGNLLASPPYMDARKTANNSYVFTLPPKNVGENNRYLRDIFNGYPKMRSSKYSDCWVEDPSYNKPCFFHDGWLGEACSEAKDFGYSEEDGVYNPCFVVRIEETVNWRPIPEAKDELPTSAKKHFDHQFVQLFCAPKNAIDEENVDNVTVYPHKGFPTAFFPVSSFNPDVYLLPAVAVQVRGIKKGHNVTIECGLLAENSLQLRNTGLLLLTFVSR